MNFKKIGFIGLGLIGGSIAMKIKKDNPDTLIYATAGRESTIKTAYEMGLTENDTKIPLEAFKDFDLIFLCAPVQKNLQYLRELKSIINPN